jgi:hypothetical protein
MAWGYGGQDFKNAKETRPYMGPKFWCPDIQVNADGNNYKLYRYADAILMKAECLCETEDYQGALKYLNMTRTRAGLDAYRDATPAALREEIRTERARELFGEFQRKFDLVRWGIWYERTYEAHAETSGSGYLTDFIKPFHKYYPIPDDQVSYSGGALNNNDYLQ